MLGPCGEVWWFLSMEQKSYWPVVWHLTVLCRVVSMRKYSFSSSKKLDTMLVFKQLRLRNIFWNRQLKIATWKYFSYLLQTTMLPKWGSFIQYCVGALIKAVNTQIGFFFFESCYLKSTHVRVSLSQSNSWGSSLVCQLIFKMFHIFVYNTSLQNGYKICQFIHIRFSVKLCLLVNFNL